MQKTTFNLWTKLKNLPYKTHCYHQYRILFQRATKSLVFVPHEISNNNKTEYVIYKYLFSKNSWKKYEIQTTKTWNGSRLIYPGAINENKIYSYTDKHEIIMLQLIDNTNKYTFNIIKNIKEIDGLHPYGTSIFVNDDFHYIANKHIKFNINSQILEIVPGSSVSQIQNGKGLTRIKDKLILFRVTNNIYIHRNIYEYDIKKQSWQTLSTSLPMALWILSCATILNGQIILISGIDYNQDDESNNIYIYEVKRKVIKKSNVKFTSEHENQIFTINDEKKDMLLTHGWIRIQCQSFNVHLPECLFRMINSYCINEFVHTINTIGHHYKINILEILNNC